MLETGYWKDAFKDTLVELYLRTYEYDITYKQEIDKRAVVNNVKPTEIIFEDVNRRMLACELESIKGDEIWMQIN